MGRSDVERKSCDDRAGGTADVALAALDVLMARAAGAEVAARTLADARRAVTAAPVARRESGPATAAAMMAIALLRE